MSRNKARNKKSNLAEDNAIQHHHQTAQMRTVSQQCTLDYSSDNPVSDSILDKSDLMSPVLSPTTHTLPASLKQIKKLQAEESSSTPMETSGTTETTAHLSSRW